MAAPATLAITGGTANHTGQFTATCSGATDKAGNVAPPVSVSYSVHYVFKEFFPPLGPGARIADFPVGTIVPVIWTLQDAQGKFITRLDAVRSVQIAPNSTCAAGGEGPPSNAKSLANLGVENILGVYDFNLVTNGLARGCYSILISLDDNSVETSIIRLR